MTTAKKNNDYSASAVNLTNSIEVESALCKLQACRGEMQALIEDIEAQIPVALTKQRLYLAETITQMETEIRALIDERGSFQNVDLGIYALKQRKVSKSYVAEKFEAAYPQFALAVIIKAVDVARLSGLVKGGLLDEAQLKVDGVLELSESYSYIIR